MTYKIAIAPKDLAYIGQLLEQQPHKDVGKLIAGIQAQIDEQDAAARAEQAEARTRAQKEWFEAETERLNREASPAVGPRTSNRRPAKTKGD